MAVVKAKKKPANLGPAPVIVSPPATPPGAAPAVPAGYQPLLGVQLSHLRKQSGPQESLTGAVAAEVLASKTWIADFGSNAPAAALLGAAMQKAFAWFTEKAQSGRWHEYAGQSAALSFDEVNGLMAVFHGLWTASIARDASIVQRYPETAAFFATRSTIAKKAAATRKAKKKAAAAAAPAAPAAPAAK